MLFYQTVEYHHLFHMARKMKCSAKYGYQYENWIKLFIFLSLVTAANETIGEEEILNIPEPVVSEQPIRDTR